MQNAKQREDRVIERVTKLLQSLAQEAIREKKNPTLFIICFYSREIGLKPCQLI